MVGFARTHALNHDNCFGAALLVALEEPVSIGAWFQKFATPRQAGFEFPLRDDSVVLSVQVLLRLIWLRAGGHDHHAVRDLVGFSARRNSGLKLAD